MGWAPPLKAIQKIARILHVVVYACHAVANANAPPKVGCQPLPLVCNLISFTVDISRIPPLSLSFTATAISARLACTKVLLSNPFQHRFVAQHVLP